MPEQTLFTAQELFHKQLLLNTKLEPITSASQIYRLVQKKATGVIKTARGFIKVLTLDQVNAHNKEMRERIERTYIPLVTLPTTIDPNS